MAEKKMKNPCWKGYEAYGMKKKNGKEVPNCVPVKEELCQLTKQNIISNLIEAKDGPGKASQRPKSWNKGTKSGSEKRKMREEGKREAREMNEGRADDFFGTDEEGNTAGLGRNWGVEHEDDIAHPYDTVAASHFEPVSWKDRSLGYKAREGSPVAIHDIPVHMLNMGTLLPKPEHEEEFLQHPNAMPYLRAVKAAHWDGYQWAADAARRGYSGGRRAAAIYTGMGKAASRLMDILRDRKRRMPGSSTGDVLENLYYAKLKNNLVENYPGAHEDYEQLARSGGRDIELDADREESQNKELAAFHAMRTHVSPEEETAMHDIFHKHLHGVQSGGKLEAFRRAQSENDAVLRGRLTELSRPEYPDDAMSHKDRLTRIHQLINLSREAERTAYQAYMG